MGAAEKGVEPHNRLKNETLRGSSGLSAIEVSSLTKSYGSLNAVDSISFEVNEGEVFSLLGPNGAGKTTTIEILEGLRERDGGDVSVLGLDPWKSGYKLHEKIGVIPQGFKFVDYATPKEAIRYYASLFGVKADPDAILKKVSAELKQTNKALESLGRKFDRFDDRVTVQTKDQEQRMRKLERRAAGGR